MKERPILFSGPMVRALLDGSKTQTRRIVKPQPFQIIHQPSECMHPDWAITNGPSRHVAVIADESGNQNRLICPYGQPGDRLWVKETHALTMEPERRNPHAKFPFAYRADWTAEDDENRDFRWKPSIFCTREASRITLEVESVRVERLNDISKEDARAEGCDMRRKDYPDGSANLSGGAGPDYWDVEGNGIHTPGLTYANAYRHLWESINGAGSWDLNPWIWAITFKRITP